MNDFEHLDRYLAQAAEETEHPFGIPDWAHNLFDGTLIPTPELLASWPHFQFGVSRSSILPHLIEREQVAKSGVSELAERLRFLYLEGTEEDADE